MVSGGGCGHELQTGCSGLPLYRQVDSDPKPQSGQWILRIRIQEGKNDPQKLKKFRNFMFWRAGWCSLLRAKGFFCSLYVLYGGIEKDNNNKFSAVIFFLKFFVIKTLDPDPQY
jgi:hypothetical protein